VSAYLPACLWGICLGTWTEYNLRVTSLGRALQRSAGEIDQQTDLKRKERKERKEEKE
jgi:hypothetical protein